MTRRAASALGRWWEQSRCEDGQGLIEYGLILVLISVASILIMEQIGLHAIQLFSDAAAAVTEAAD